MMQYDFQSKDATSKELVDFLDVIADSKYFPDERVAIESFKQLWTKALISKHIITYLSPSTLLTQEYRCYAMKHEFIDYDITIYFNIDEMHRLIRNRLVPFDKMRLSDCLHLINFAETNSTRLLPHAFDEPVLIAYMLSQNGCGVTTTGEVIDGNHRVSAALYLKEDIDNVVVLNTALLPPSAFKNTTSWILYSLLSGIKIIAGGFFSDDYVVDYLTQLERFLNVYFL